MFNHRWDIVHALPYIKKKKALIHLTAHQLKLSEDLRNILYWTRFSQNICAAFHAAVQAALLQWALNNIIFPSMSMGFVLAQDKNLYDKNKTIKLK